MPTMIPAEAQAVAGLVGYWTFDAQTLADLTFPADDGTFVGDAAIVAGGQTFGANGVAPVADAGLTGAGETG